MRFSDKLEVDAECKRVRAKAGFPEPPLMSRAGLPAPPLMSRAGLPDPSVMSGLPDPPLMSRASLPEPPLMSSLPAPPLMSRPFQFNPEAPEFIPGASGLSWNPEFIPADKKKTAWHGCVCVMDLDGGMAADTRSLYNKG